ncbi:MAG TPA: glycerol-3-phosphate dehydrogenase/oxidase, partial [Solirubrobacterales bacterium]|nr:glycerol-3-phosphate dehydrogenase/oxidase [Solirubrobacterales bacterium]
AVPRVPRAPGAPGVPMLSRARALEEIAGQRFEVVVIGGGITGAGVALDAASRGYSVALLERDDYAVGTSSRSSKMVHGGLRYLQNFDLGLVREALVERQLMVQLAPHLVYPTPFLVPALGEERRDRRVGLGLNAYDVMATTRVGRSRREMRSAKEEDEDFYWSPDRHRTIDGAEVLEMIPALGPRDPQSAYLFYDCQTDDVRLVLTVLGEAERFGAVMLNGAEVTEVLSSGGRASGVAFVEAESGERIEVEAENVVNATGVWADRIRPEEVIEEEDVPRIVPSRGTHVILDQADLPMGRAACIVPAGEGRMIFSLPWYGRTLIGTTDNDYAGDTVHPKPAEDDVEYLLDAVNSFFGTSLGGSDLVGAYAGVRPLISTGDPRKSVDISRKAELYETSSGMLTITGGKLTTWRRMAKLTVDRLVEREGRGAPCHTAEIPLGMEARPEDLEAPQGVGEEAIAQLAFRYGHAARAVLALAREAPGLARPIVAGRPDLLAEAVIAARLEQARSVADVLLRRTRLGILAASQLRSVESVGPVAEAMGGELGWSEERIAREAEAWPAAAAEEGVDPAGAAAAQVE